MPTLPVPAYKSRNDAPRIFSPRMLNSASLTRSIIGRVPVPGTRFNWRPFAVPAITRIGMRESLDLQPRLNVLFDPQVRQLLLCHASQHLVAHGLIALHFGQFFCNNFLCLLEGLNRFFALCGGFERQC